MFHLQIERERRAKEQDLVKDMEMEIDRLQTIKMYKDREAELKHKLVEDRKVIEQQIARRAKEREAHKEAIRAEQAERKLQMQRQAEQEKEELAIEQERQRVHLAEVLKANSAAIAAKEKLVSNAAAKLCAPQEHLSPSVHPPQLPAAPYL